MNFSSFYVHIPFCLEICDYCAFYIIDKANSTLRQRYLKRLNSELSLKGPLCHSMKTIYLGGGTPSYFSVTELKTLMASLNMHLNIVDDCEFTFECNPDSLTEEKVKVLLDGGVNRFSVGVQSFSQNSRDRIGRAGDISRIYQAVALLRALNVENFNCDLIYGIPGQTLSQWEKDLWKIAELDPPHVSAYQLTVEKGTRLANRGTEECKDKLAIAMSELTHAYLSDRCRLHRYEISNLAKTGFQCQHNNKTWMGAPFLGAGPSAAYFDGRSRWTNPADLHKWMLGDPPIEDYIEPSARALEILITGLRTIEGWNRQHFIEATGFDFIDLRGAQINEFIQSCHMHFENNTLRLSDKGLLVADYIGRQLLA